MVPDAPRDAGTLPDRGWPAALGDGAADRVDAAGDPPPRKLDVHDTHGWSAHPNPRSRGLTSPSPRGWPRGRSAVLRVAAVSSTVIAVLSVPPLVITVAVPAGERAFHLLLILLTITAIVIARSELVASHSGPSPARTS